MTDQRENARHEDNLNKVEFVSRRSCPLHDGAGSAASSELHYFKSVYDKLTGRTFQILRCPMCGVCLTDPYPTEETVRWLYEGRGSVQIFDPIHGTIIDRLKDFFARRDLRKIYAKAGRPTILSVLDFGAGNGRFALASKRVFPRSRVDAVDFDSYPPPSLTGVNGVNYLSMATFLQGSARYDLIILRHVLEHLHDPIEFLRSMARRLSPGGILYIEVPNIESAHVRCFSSIANALFVPYHLFNFHVPSLENVVRTAGLHYKIINQKALPMVGCVMAAVLKQERGIAHQVLGIILHPIQMVMDWMYGKYILAAVCQRDENT